MATSKETAESYLEILLPMGDVHIRPMFGEYTVYFEGKPFGLIADGTFFIKKTKVIPSLDFELEEGAPYPGAKPAYIVDGPHLQNLDWLFTFIRNTADVLPLPKPKPSKK